MRIDIIERKNDILGWIKLKYTKAEICRELKCKPGTLNSYLKKMDIYYTGNQGAESRKKSNRKIRAIEYLYNGSTISSHKLKNKLIEEEIKKHKCETCKKTTWLGNLIPLELHHIDGDTFNNELINLKLVCPNCHTVTDNYRGKKNKKNEQRIYEKNLCECGKQKTIRAKICKVCHHNRFKKCDPCSITVCKKCDSCGIEVCKKSNLCKKCNDLKQRKVVRPPYEQLLKEIEETNYSAVGRKYGVSDNAIRKWIENYEKELNNL